VKYIALALAAVLLSSAANAQNCEQYNPGPQRFACLSAKNPWWIAKRERCKQEAANMGLRVRGGGGALAGYMEACMKRR
jgi:hypothetical protein